MMEMYMAYRLNTVRTCYHQINLDNCIFNTMLANLVTRQRGSALVSVGCKPGSGAHKKTPGSLSAAYASMFWINFSGHIWATKTC